MIRFSLNDLLTVKEGLQKYCNVCLRGDTDYAVATLMLNDDLEEGGEKYFFHANGDPDKGYGHYAKEHEGLRDLYYAMRQIASTSCLSYLTVYFLDGEMRVAAEREKEE